MKRQLSILLACSVAFITTSWGFFAHQRINQLACLTLPKGMLTFYKQHIQYLTDHSVDADKRRYVDSLEASKHYLDVEHYETSIDSIPERWNDAVKKYGLPKLQKDGMIPWQIQRTYYNLVNSFKAKDSLRILKYSADLGHYIGDAHVPLHTTSNHNGQLTGQRGIHAFWESRVPELFSAQYNLFTGKAKYINDPLKEAWSIVKGAHTMVDSVLRFEAHLNAIYPTDKKYSFSERNKQILKQYSEPYALSYQTMLNGMIERQMRKSILAIGSYWYSAWADAGQPVLKKFNPREKTNQEKTEAETEEAAINKGKLIGREF